MIRVHKIHIEINLTCLCKERISVGFKTPRPAPEGAAHCVKESEAPPPLPTIFYPYTQKHTPEARERLSDSSALKEMRQFLFSFLIYVVLIARASHTHIYTAQRAADSLFLFLLLLL